MAQQAGQRRRPLTEPSGQIVTAKQKEESIISWLEGARKGIRLPPRVNLDRLKWETYMAIRKNPRLLECERDSLLNAILQIASYGLYPGPLAHLVPYGRECVPILDYKGMVHLVIEAGARKVEGSAVHEGDEFWFTRGTEPKIHHIPSLDPARSQKPITHFYAIVYLPDGDTQFEVLDRAEVDKVMNNTAAVRRGQSTPWNEWYEAMGIKTAIRRVAKVQRKGSDEIARAIDFEERMDAGLAPNWDMPVKQVEAQAAAQAVHVDKETGEILDGQAPDQADASGFAASNEGEKSAQDAETPQEEGDTPPEEHYRDRTHFLNAMMAQHPKLKTEAQVRAAAGAKTVDDLDALGYEEAARRIADYEAMR